jgi:hypothetical protein
VVRRLLGVVFAPKRRLNGLFAVGSEFLASLLGFIRFALGEGFVEERPTSHFRWFKNALGISSLLSLLEIPQIRRSLVLLDRHQVSIGADGIEHLADANQLA